MKRNALNEMAAKLASKKADNLKNKMVFVCNESMTVRMPIDLKKAIEQQAEAFGMKPSSFVRKALSQLFIKYEYTK